MNESTESVGEVLWNGNNEGMVTDDPHHREVLNMAAKYLRRFFASKRYANGSLVEEKDFLKIEHLVTVLNMTLSDCADGVDQFYDYLDTLHGLVWDAPNKVLRWAKTGEVLTTKERGQQDTADIKYLVNLLHECRRLRIPHTLVMGLACVHAKVVGQWVEPDAAAMQAAALIEITENEDEADIEDLQEPDEIELALISQEQEFTKELQDI